MIVMTGIAAWTDNLNTGADGVTVGTGNSIFTAFTGSGTSVFETTGAFEGAACVVVTTAGANRSLEKPSIARGSAWIGFALKIITAPSAVSGIMNTYVGNVLVGNLRLNTNRTLNYRDSATSRWTSLALALDEWYEIRVKTNPAADLASVRVYDDTGTLFDDEIDMTLSVVSTTTIDEFRIGLLSGNTNGSIAIDRIISDDTDEPPTLAGSAPPPYLFYDNGTTWISGVLYYDNGTSWVEVEPGDVVP